MSLLRRSGQSQETLPTGDETGFPPLDQPYILDERSAGVRFYRGRESFFFSYALLQSMKLAEEKLTISFATGDIEIIGRGLHSLYAHFSGQKVACVIQQGERYAGAMETATFVSRIEVLLR
ncbi:MAG: hypothetical protein L0Z50_39925 [Verrucomicrobiales bacterium]|nr:hypothetical protein [Verrucomicrobiales bacterium]